MNEQDVKFLVALKNELLTQPTDGNCDPRFWGVKERERIFGFESEAAEGWVVYDGESVCDIGNPNDIQSVINNFIDDYEFDAADFEEEHDDYDSIDITDIEDVVSRANQVMAKANGFSSNYAPFSVAYYQDYYRVNEDALFFTKKACQEHINRYGYNYKEPCTYVMTADRCPEYETLLRIIKETDWERMSRMNQKEGSE